MLHSKFCKRPVCQIWGAVIGAVGGMMANSARSREAEISRDYQQRLADTAYQRAMNDMHAAGLNPMLAYSQGGAHVPAGAMAQVENVGSAAMAGMQQAASAESSLQQADTAAAVGDAVVEKTKQEIVNLKSTDDQIKAITQNLGEEYQNLVKNGYNLTEVGNQIRASIEKLKAETSNLPWEQLRIRAQEMLASTQAELNKFDISAAQSMENIGREAGQLRPFFEILRAIAGMRGGK